MWNYDYMIPGFLIMLILLAYYMVLPRLPLRLNNAFLTILTLECLVISIDYLATRADENYMLFSNVALYIFNLLFFILFYLRIYSIYCFTVNIIHRRPTWNIRWTLISLPVLVVTCLVALSSPWTGAVFSIGENGYQSGPAYKILYVCGFYYLLVSLIILVVHRKRLNRFRFVSALCYHFILLAGLIARWMLPQYLIMNTFCLMAILIIYLSFENPDLYLEPRGKAFNMDGFREWLHEDISQKHFQILGFVIRDYHDARGIYGGEQVDRGVTQINEYLVKNFPGYLVFCLGSGRFVLVGPGSMDWKDTHAEISKRFQGSWNTEEAELEFSVSFIHMETVPDLDSADRTISDLLLAFENVSHGYTEDEIVEMDRIREIDGQVNVRRQLEKAIDEHTLEVFLQPLIDARSRKLIGAEALARIRDEAGEIIPPNTFIPLAEKSGRIIELGEQIFEMTCDFIGTHDLEKMGLMWINVNLSPVQCMKKDLSDRFSSILNRYQVSADKIHLEITEQSMIDFVLLHKQIAFMQGRGFHFVLDDYGSGYSNITRVKNYPFINIKLDMEVVWDYFRERDAFLPAIVSAFKQMGFSVTAEGIETKEMADVMEEIGCDFLQGYYFSRPVPLKEFLEKYGQQAVV